MTGCGLSQGMQRWLNPPPQKNQSIYYDLVQSYNN